MSELLPGSPVGYQVVVVNDQQQQKSMQYLVFFPSKPDRLAHNIVKFNFYPQLNQETTLNLLTTLS